MPDEILCVRNIRGRYPHSGVLRSCNLVATVRPLGDFLVIRIDDEEFSDAWFEITVQLNEESAPSADGLARPAEIRL